MAGELEEDVLQRRDLRAEAADPDVLVSDDVDGWHARLTAAGAEIDGPPHVLEQFGIYTFFARDPNGYRIEFQKFLET